MDTAYSVINYNPTTKQQAESFAQKLTEEVLQGEVNPLELHVKLTAMGKAFDEVKKNIASLVLSEAEKHGAKSFEYNNSKIDIQELGVKYDFTDCGDIVWNQLNSALEDLKLKMKEREAFLKAVKAKTGLVDTETGESYEVFPPKKSSTTGIKVTLK